MTDCLPSNTPLEETGFGYTLSLINGKYKMIIMYWLYGKTVMRFNELQRCIGNISFRTLRSASSLSTRHIFSLNSKLQMILPMASLCMSTI